MGRSVERGKQAVNWRKATGYMLLYIPTLGMISGIVHSVGWKATLYAFGILAGLALWISVTVWLIYGEDKPEASKP